MDIRVLALCELSNDLLYDKIPMQKLSYYIDESLRIGKEAAGRYQGYDLETLYAEHRINIDYQEDGTAGFGMAYRGQITLEKGNCSTVIFRSSIRGLAENSANGEFPAVSYELAKNMHLAHEFFHFLEFESDSYVPRQLEPVITMNFPGFKRRARINRCSEVAAHAFAKALLDLNVLPNYYDYCYLINTGKMTEEAFEGMLEKNQKVLYAKTGASM